MKERKAIIITIIVAIVIAGTSIAIFLFLLNSSTDVDTQNAMDSISEDEGGSTNDNGNNSSNNVAEDDKAYQSMIEGDRVLLETLSSDPIWEYLKQPYRTDNFTISMVVDKNTNPMIVILINTSKPTTSQGQAITEQFKNEALQQIRNWGFDPSSYTVEVGYRY